MLVWAGIAAVVLGAAAFAVSRLKPAAPPVERSTIWTDTVKRGPMVRQVRGSTGVLVPREDSIELIPAQTDATVVRIRVLRAFHDTPYTDVGNVGQLLLHTRYLKPGGQHFFNVFVDI